MTQPHNPVPHPPPHNHGRSTHRGAGLPIAACCVPLLAVAVMLVLTDRAGATFVILFTSSTAIMALLMAAAGYPGLAITVRRRDPPGDTVPAGLLAGLAARRSAGPPPPPSS